MAKVDFITDIANLLFDKQEDRDSFIGNNVSGMTNAIRPDCPTTLNSIYGMMLGVVDVNNKNLITKVTNSIEDLISETIDELRYFLSVLVLSMTFVVLLVMVVNGDLSWSWGMSAFLLFLGFVVLANYLYIYFTTTASNGEGGTGGGGIIQTILSDLQDIVKTPADYKIINDNFNDIMTRARNQRIAAQTANVCV